MILLDEIRDERKYAWVYEICKYKTQGMPIYLLPRVWRTM